MASSSVGFPLGPATSSTNEDRRRPRSTRHVGRVFPVVGSSKGKVAPVPEVPDVEMSTAGPESGLPVVAGSMAVVFASLGDKGKAEESRERTSPKLRLRFRKSPSPARPASTPPKRKTTRPTRRPKKAAVSKAAAAAAAAVGPDTSGSGSSNSVRVRDPTKTYISGNRSKKPGTYLPWLMQEVYQPNGEVQVLFNEDDDDASADEEAAANEVSVRIVPEKGVSRECFSGLVAAAQAKEEQDEDSVSGSRGTEPAHVVETQADDGDFVMPDFVESSVLPPPPPPSTSSRRSATASTLLDLSNSRAARYAEAEAEAVIATNPFPHPFENRRRAEYVPGTYPKRRDPGCALSPEDNWARIKATMEYRKVKPENRRVATEIRKMHAEFRKKAAEDMAGDVAAKRKRARDDAEFRKALARDGGAARGQAARVETAPDGQAGAEVVRLAAADRPVRSSRGNMPLRLLL